MSVKKDNFEKGNFEKGNFSLDTSVLPRQFLLFKKVILGILIVK